MPSSCQISTRNMVSTAARIKARIFCVLFARERGIRGIDPHDMTAVCCVPPFPPQTPGLIREICGNATPWWICFLRSTAGTAFRGIFFTGLEGCEDGCPSTHHWPSLTPDVCTVMSSCRPSQREGGDDDDDDDADDQWRAPPQSAGD